MEAIRNVIDEVGYQIFPRFNGDRESRKDMNLQMRIVEIAVNCFIGLSGVISFLAFPELTIAGFIVGHIFRDHIRQSMADLFNTFLKVDLISKFILGLFTFVSWPYLYLLSPVIIGSYIGWETNDQHDCREWYLFPPKS